MHDFRRVTAAAVACIVACIAACAAAAPARAQTPPPAVPPPAVAVETRFAAALDSTLRARAYPVRLEGGRLAGAGADSLAAEAARAQFVLVGEEHGTAEVPRFVAALLGRVRPAGYRYLALEVGPRDAALLDSLARVGDPRLTLPRFRRDEGSVFPFYSGYADDAALLAAARADSVALWGLDQAYQWSTPSQLARLAALAPTPAGRALALGFHARDLAAARADTGPALGEAGGRFFSAATAADFRALRAAFGAGPAGAARAAAVDILDELEESAAIYQLNGARSPDANARRARLMKRHLWAYYQAAVRAGDARPKALFKFGGVHVGRGASPLGVYDIGNTASELAELGGAASYHVGFWSLDPDDVLLPALRAVPAGAWAVLDLRPLRPLLARAERAGARPDPGLVGLARRYDAVILAPRLTRSARLPRG